MSKEKIIDKIRKCLELSKSDNVHEAESAMLMATKLMSQYNIDMLMVEKQDKTEVSEQTYREKSAKFAWVRSLARVIAENNRCKILITVSGRSKYITFVGFDIDIEVCNLLFEYALTCIDYSTRKFDKFGKDSYRVGFRKGLKEKYDKQKEQEVKENESFALVCQVPVEVTNYLDNEGYEHKDFGGFADFSVNSDAYNNGYEDGKSHSTALQCS